MGKVQMYKIRIIRIIMLLLFYYFFLSDLQVDAYIPILWIVRAEGFSAMTRNITIQTEIFHHDVCGVRVRVCAGDIGWGMP